MTCRAFNFSAWRHSRAGDGSDRPSRQILIDSTRWAVWRGNSRPADNMEDIRMNMQAINSVALVGVLMAACGIDDRSTATLDQMNQGASSAGDGVSTVNFTIEAGNGVAGLDVVDGWTVRYDKLLVAVGDVKESSGSAPESFADETTYLVDLLQVPADGASMATGALARMSFESAEFSTLIPSDGTLLILATDADRDLMVKAGYSIYIEGSMTNARGRSCRPDDPTDCTPAPMITFSWGLAAAASFSGCDGFTLSGNETAELTVTLPGDHWFLGSFSVDAERSPRRAQWVADADLDRDGETTLAELRAIKAEVLFSPKRGYDLSTVAVPVETAYDFLAAQVRTIGINSANGCGLGTPID
ncbi:hypothetical protein [Nannocystis sp.]|uniref:hypothetical protein n=1 Tax=Nannocystis sp. TaxID=1962667 RepID=UPI0025E54C9A|nr:hypothetical protein [Nannocystis sp.]